MYSSWSRRSSRPNVEQASSLACLCVEEKFKKIIVCSETSHGERVGKFSLAIGCWWLVAGGWWRAPKSRKSTSIVGCGRCHLKIPSASSVPLPSSLFLFHFLTLLLPPPLPLSHPVPLSLCRALFVPFSRPPPRLLLLHPVTKRPDARRHLASVHFRTTPATPLFLAHSPLLSLWTTPTSSRLARLFGFSRSLSRPVSRISVWTAFVKSMVAMVRQKRDTAGMPLSS